MTKLLPRAAAAVFLLLASVQPPAWADAPIFRYNLHGVNIGPGPGPGPSGDASLAYPPALGTMVSGTALSAAEGTPALSGLTPPIAFSLAEGPMPGGLSLDPASGMISGVPAQAGTYLYMVEATGQTGSAYASIQSLVTAASTATLSYAALPSPVAVGTAVSSDPVVTGMTAPVAYTVAGGAMPPGVALGNGPIGGMPGTAGTYEFTVQATGANGATASATLAEAVNGTLAYILPQSLPLSVGYASAAPSPSGMSAITSYAVQNGALPPGLAVDASTGVISGTPSANGTYTFSITGTNSGQAAFSPSYTIVTGTADGSIAYPTLQAQITAGVPFTPVPAVVTGLTGASGFTLLSGSLPPGVYLDGASGTLLGNSWATAAGTYAFTIQSVDYYGKQVSVALSQVVNGALDYAIPDTLSTAGSFTSAAPDKTGMSAISSYTVASGGLPPGMTLLPSGAISGTPAAAGTYSFAISGTNSTQTAFSPTYTVTVTDTPVSLAYPTLPSQMACGTAAPASYPVLGGIAGVFASYSIAAGSLPPGMSFNTTAPGIIAGTPYKAGTFSFTVSVTDTTANTASAEVSQVVNGTVGYSLPPSLAAGQTYASAAPSLCGMSAVTSYTVASGNLPPGMSVSPAGIIGGTPTAAGTYTFSIAGTNASQAAYSPEYAISVVDGTPSVTYPAALASLAYGAWFYGLAPSTAGLAAPVTYAVTGGTLPPGLSIARGDGSIGGTPSTVGVYPYTIQATDRNGATATAAAVTTVNGTLAYTLPAGLDMPQGYTSAAPVSGGMSAITSYAVSSGALPPGLALLPSGAISGTPAATGTYSFAISGANSTQTAFSPTYTMTVLDGTAAAISYPAALASPALNVAASFQPVLTGLGGTAVFSITGGTLPTGLQMSSDGYISGTPTAAGSYACTITAVDRNNAQATATVTSQINGSLAYTLPVTLSAAQAYASAAPKSAGVSALTSFSVSSGALPPGMALSPSGVISGTPAAAGSYSFAISGTNGSQTAFSPSYSLSVVTPYSTSLDYPTMPVTLAVGAWLPIQAPMLSGLNEIVSYRLVGGTMPPGASLSATLGEIGGRLTKAGTYTYVIQVTDSENNTAMATITNIVTP